MNIRITKKGEIYKADKERLKRAIKENTNLDTSGLPKKAQTYAKQVLSGMRRGALNAKRLKDPDTGTFLPKHIEVEIRKEARLTEQRTNGEFKAEQILENKQSVGVLKSLILNKTNSKTFNSHSFSLLINSINKPKIKFVEIDSNRIISVKNKTELNLLMAEIKNAILTNSDAFDWFFKVDFNLRTNEVFIYVPDGLVNAIKKGDTEKIEAILEEFGTEMHSDYFGLIISNNKKNEDPKPKAGNGKNKKASK